VYSSCTPNNQYFLINPASSAHPANISLAFPASTFHCLPCINLRAPSRTLQIYLLPSLHQPFIAFPASTFAHLRAPCKYISCLPCINLSLPSLHQPFKFIFCLPCINLAGRLTLSSTNKLCIHFKGGEYTKGQRKVNMLFSYEFAYGLGGGALTIRDWQRPQTRLFSPTPHKLAGSE